MGPTNSSLASNFSAVISSRQLVDFHQFLEKYKNNPKVATAVSEALMHDEIQEASLNLDDTMLEDGRISEDEEFRTEKKSRPRKRPSKTEEHEIAGEKASKGKPKKLKAESIELPSVSKKTVESSKDESEKESKKPSKRPITEKDPAQMEKKSVEAKKPKGKRDNSEIIIEKVKKPVEKIEKPKKAEEKSKSTPEAKLRSIRDILFQTLTNPNANEDQLLTADKSMSLLEKIQLDMDLFKATGIGRLVKSLSKKEKLPGDKYQFLKRCKDLMVSWKEKIRTSDVFNKPPQEEAISDESVHAHEEKQQVPIQQSQIAAIESDLQPLLEETGGILPIEDSSEKKENTMASSKLSAVEKTTVKPDLGKIPKKPKA